MRVSKRRRPGGAGREGMALLVALLVSACLGVLAGALVASVVHGLARQDERLARDQAAAAAEAGVAAARARLATDPSYAGEGPVALGPASFEVRVTPAGEDERDVEARGGILEPRSAQWVVTARLRKLAGPGGARWAVVEWDER
ncbi:MAG: hypothetical protein HYZ53_09350 [Planctomycetes bacterium]|nr:hypothetical protein [Planctomycetota bacterium]